MTQKFQEQASLFILVLNQTTPYYKDGRNGSEVRFFNSSQRSAVIFNLAESTEYLIIAYLVDFQQYIFRSHEIIISTDVGGKAFFIGSVLGFVCHIFDRSLTLVMTLKKFVYIYPALPGVFFSPVVVLHCLAFNN